MKKALLIILVAIMCIGILPISVFAEESGSQIYTETKTESENIESASENEEYDFIDWITNFKLETFSDFVYLFIVIIVAIIAIFVVLVILIILIIVFGVILETVIAPTLTVLMGPIGTVGGTLLSIVGAIAGAILAILEFVLPYLPEILILFETIKQFF